MMPRKEDEVEVAEKGRSSRRKEGSKTERNKQEQEVK